MCNAHLASYKFEYFVCFGYCVYGAKSVIVKTTEYAPETYTRVARNRVFSLICWCQRNIFVKNPVSLLEVSPKLHKSDKNTLKERLAMLKQKASPESVLPPEKEQESIAQLAQILSRESAQPKLVTSNGEEILIPESVCNILRQAVQAMASDQAVSIVRYNRELTTQQAANILNVSRPFLVKLLDEGAIPYIKVGSHRRIRFKGLIIYKEHRDRKRRKLLDQLIEMTEEAGLYEE